MTDTAGASPKRIEFTVRALILGSILGVIVGTDNGSPFGLVPADSFWVGPYPMIAGIVAFFGLAWALYAWTKSKADTI